MDIRILPANIANLIAAGEVVQRPASVVKELMENAIDAGATQITVIVADAGRTLIQVIDNGCGMSPDEAVLCFERHATSKIATAEDLSDIMTFGFRGEALASIAAVAEVTLKTRQKGEDVGCQVEFAASRHLSTNEIATPEGTSFAVRNLFYNVPARRKFLKSDNVELRHIIDEFTRVALTRPEIGFSLISGDKEIYVLKPAKSLKFRIQDLLGKGVAGQVADVLAETTVARVSGFAGRPDTARKTLGNQFFFVNGRFFKSPYFHKAVMKAYENILPQGTTPAYFIYIEVDPHTIDVNIHPAKTEIKFEDDSVLFQIIYACIKEAIGRNSFGASIDFDRDNMPELPAFSSDFSKFRPDVVRPGADFDSSYNPFESSAASSSPGGDRAGDVIGGWHHPDTGGYIDRREDYGKLFEDKEISLPSVIVLKKKYVVTTAKDGLLFVNIRRAEERILYDRFLNALKNGGHVCQTALFPVQVVVGADNRLVFDEHQELLGSLGFDISPFGLDTIVVNGMPEGFKVDQSSVESTMADILMILTEDHSSLPGMMESSMAERFARIGAAAGGDIESSGQAKKLIDTLFSTSNPEYTSGGKKIMAVMSPDEVEKRF